MRISSLNRFSRTLNSLLNSSFQITQSHQLNTFSRIKFIDESQQRFVSNTTKKKRYSNEENLAALPYTRHFWNSVHTTIDRLPKLRASNLFRSVEDSIFVDITTIKTTRRLHWRLISSLSSLRCTEWSLCRRYFQRRWQKFPTLANFHRRKICTFCVNHIDRLPHTWKMWQPQRVVFPENEIEIRTNVVSCDEGLDETNFSPLLPHHAIGFSMRTFLWKVLLDNELNCHCSSKSSTVFPFGQN